MYILYVFSLGMEVLEVIPEPDVVVVCCGAGGLLSGVAAAIKLSGCDKTRIYGVEPEGGKNSPKAVLIMQNQCRHELCLILCLF